MTLEDGTDRLSKSRNVGNQLPTLTAQHPGKWKDSLVVAIQEKKVKKILSSLPSPFVYVAKKLLS